MDFLPEMLIVSDRHKIVLSVETLLVAYFSRFGNSTFPSKTPS